MIRIADALQAVIAALWVGALWTAGFVVAPMLFAALDRGLAGQLAGSLFGLVAWIGIGCAAGLLACRIVCHRKGVLRQRVLWVVLLMLALTLAGEFGVQPMMAALREQVLPQQIMAPALRERFAVLHGVATGLYVIQCVLGVALVILLNRK